MNYSLITHSDVFYNTALLVLDQMAFSKLAHVNLSSPICVSFHQGFPKDGMSGDKTVIYDNTNYSLININDHCNTEVFF